jgi:hypothetical protein
VFNNVLYSDLAGPGWLTITYDHASFLDQTFCTGSAVDSVFIDLAAGMREGTKATTLLHPNPANEVVHLKVGGLAPQSAFMSDVLGRRILEIPLRVCGPDGSFAIDVSQVANGSYRLTVIDAWGGWTSIPLLVQH